MSQKENLNMVGMNYEMLCIQHRQQDITYGTCSRHQCNCRQTQLALYVPKLHKLASRDAKNKLAGSDQMVNVNAGRDQTELEYNTYKRLGSLHLP